MRRDGALGLTMLGKGRLRGAEGECGTSLMRGSKEKEPGSSRGPQWKCATTGNSDGYMRKKSRSPLNVCLRVCGTAGCSGLRVAKPLI